ncbi:Olfactory receptor 52D1 [Collichthys lucidus]|uniref:Olfactory receptor 52D1 n=1 Tax=Collichthys lucidus TaxID=240159 RepID=A0A4V6ARS7_COLLU|nr:Olfactory receptor 52D1 [Collichthys lucidus]TKS80499.1 Olfactory receptor 52D1 [Collichthys lucidus]
MINSTQVSYFTLSAYFDTGSLKYLYFMIVMSLYIVIIIVNASLIVVICMHRSLHEPMYIFLCSLFMNELYGSTGLFPFLLIQILSDVHTVSASVCFLQMYCIHTYAAVQFVNLAVMSYDRYVAICYPLHYNTLMTSSKIAMFIALTWLYPLIACIVIIYLNSHSQLCGNIINKVYCDSHSVVKLACSYHIVVNIYGLIVSFGTISIVLVFILYTYMKILKVCFSGSKQTRQKAVSTCTPHLASIFNFTVGASFEMIQSRFDMSSLPKIMRIFLSLYFLTCQPLFNPVMYGLNLSKIRVTCKSLMSYVGS